MTVETATTAVELEGNGVAREFSFSPIRIFDETQLEVVVRDDDGNLTTIPRGTGSAAYSVQATFTENESATGSIRYPDSGGTLLPAGWFINIRRVVPLTQTEIDLENQGGYLPEVQEKAFDLMSMRSLQLQEQIDRAVQVPFGSTLTSEEFYTAIVTGAATATTKAAEAEASADDAAADAIQTGLDRVQTGLDRVQTGLDRVATGEDVVSAEAARDLAGGYKDASEAARDLAEGYKDAAEAARDLAEGYKDAAEAARDLAEGYKDAAAASAAKLVGTSTSSVAIGLGTKSFVTQAGKSFAVGTWVNIVSDADPAANFMAGQVTGYDSSDGDDLEVNVTRTSGSGTHSDWTIYVAGATGEQGPAGSVTDGDKGDITVSSSGSVWTIDSGAVTLAKQADLATQRVIGRNTSGTGVPEAVTVSQLLDWVGSAADGDILYRASGAWTRLAKGTGLQQLRMNAGATAPEWFTASSAAPYIHYMLIGGGGGGGNSGTGATAGGGGGGGAGQVIAKSFLATVGTFPVTLASAAAANTAGGTAQFNGETAAGGGRGGNGGDSGGGAGQAGGSGYNGGGGGAGGGGSGSAGGGGATTGGGFNGAAGDNGGGGGGGAGGGGGGAGGNAPAPIGSGTGNSAGAGVQSDIRSTYTAYAAGGAGPSSGTGGAASGFGQGGSGAGPGNGNTGQTGGPPGCIIAYRTGTLTATGGTITYFNGYTVHTFTSTGDFEVTSIP